MAIAVRLSTGSHLVPVALSAGETVTESPIVHSAGGYVVLEPGESSFSITGRPERTSTRTLRHYARITAVADLPETADEDQMQQLRRVWENVDAFYRRVEDVTAEVRTPQRTVELAQCRIVDIDADDAPPANAAGWTVEKQFWGIPEPLSALVPGTLSAVPDLVAARLTEHGLRVRAAPPRLGADTATLTVEFTVPYADARTRLVKKNPLNNRRNAARVRVPETKFVTLTAPVPVRIAAPTLQQAHQLVAGIVEEIAASVSDPVAACPSCDGTGLLLAAGVRERTV